MWPSNYFLSALPHAVPELLYPATCCPRTTVSMPHAVPELLYPCHRSISLISIPHSSWFTTGIRSSLWESRKLTAVIYASTN